jgi:hypothetical protein
MFKFIVKWMFYFQTTIPQTQTTNIITNQPLPITHVLDSLQKTQTFTTLDSAKVFYLKLLNHQTWHPFEIRNLKVLAPDGQELDFDKLFNKKDGR